MKKRWIAVLTTAVLMMSLTVNVWAAEWQEDASGWWYMEDDGTYPAGEWKLIGGRYYYFGMDGYMLADTITPDGCAVGADGARMYDDSAQTSRTGSYTVYRSEGQMEWEGPADEFTVSRLDEKNYRVSDGGLFSGVFTKIGGNSFQCEKYIQYDRYTFTLSFVGTDSLRITQVDGASRLPVVRYCAR